MFQHPRYYLSLTLGDKVKLRQRLEFIPADMGKIAKAFGARQHQFEPGGSLLNCPVVTCPKRFPRFQLNSATIAAKHRGTIWGDQPTGGIDHEVSGTRQELVLASLDNEKCFGILDGEIGIATSRLHRADDKLGFGFIDRDTASNIIRPTKAGWHFSTLDHLCKPRLQNRIFGLETWRVHVGQVVAQDLHPVALCMGTRRGEIETVRHGFLERTPIDVSPPVTRFKDVAQGQPETPAVYRVRKKRPYSSFALSLDLRICCRLPAFDDGQNALPMDSEENYDEHVLDHYEDPYHRGSFPEATHAFEASNPLCGDVVRIELKIASDGTIEEAWFEGDGTVVSQASASMLIEAIEGKTVDEVREFSADDMLELFGPKLPINRQKCCLLAWRVLKNAIQSPIDEDDDDHRASFGGPSLNEES